MIFILDPPVAVGIVGVGLALAREFLRFGDNVVICSRSGKYLTVSYEDLVRVSRIKTLSYLCFRY
jgi:short-subunit dehydrogenase involved in D-alanine esterification of teichoic acids